MKNTRHPAALKMTFIFSTLMLLLSADAWGQAGTTQAQRMAAVKEEYQKGCIAQTTNVSAGSCATRKATIDNYEANLKANKPAPANTAGQPATSTQQPAANTPTFARDSDGNQVQTYKTANGDTVTVTKYNEGGGSIQKVNSRGEIIDTEHAMAHESQDKLNAKAKELGVDRPAEMKSEFDANKADINAAADSSPKGISNEAKKAVDDKQAPKPDPAQTARENKGAVEDKSLTQELTALKTQVQAAKTKAISEANIKCASPEVEFNTVLLAECTSQAVVQKAIACADKNIALIEKAKSALDPQKEACTKNSAEAEKLCSMVRSDKAIMVQQLMSAGATVLSSVTAASEACGTTQNLAKVAQGGMLLAQAACAAVKFRCDISCASAEKLMVEIKTGATALKVCGLDKLQSTQMSGAELVQSAGRISARLDKELQATNTVPAAIVQCKKHSADIATMGMQVLGFAQASLEAKTCKEQLSAGQSGKGTNTAAGGPASSLTTADYCAIPANASSTTCKCTKGPNTDGCLGSIAKSGINIGHVAAGGGASAFAGAGSGSFAGVNASNPADKKTASVNGAGLSAAAREALGLPANSSAESTAAGTGPGSGAASTVGALAKQGSAENLEKGKYNFSSSSGLGGSGGSGASRSAGGAGTNRPGYTDEQEKAVQRKLASEQAKAEISSASGISNFEKMRNRYRIDSEKFLAD